ncbi:hypothetical protein [Nocardia sp. NPDC050710]|uniref:hypothetical protein n=1 Tax=Nocardia sp. NPDC050710 TaxID=3157220 RepID=UPI0033D42308
MRALEMRAVLDELTLGNRDVPSQLLDPGAPAAFANAIGQTLASAFGLPVCEPPPRSRRRR